MAKKPDFIRFFAHRGNGSFFGSRRERHLSNPLSYNVFIWDPCSNPTVSVKGKQDTDGILFFFVKIQRCVPLFTHISKFDIEVIVFIV